MMLYLKHTNRETGKSHITWHSCWDAERFVKSVQDQYNNPKKPEPVTVSVVTEQDYIASRKRDGN